MSVLYIFWYITLACYWVLTIWCLNKNFNWVPGIFLHQTGVLHKFPFVYGLCHTDYTGYTKHHFTQAQWQHILKRVTLCKGFTLNKQNSFEGFYKKVIRSDIVTSWAAHCSYKNEKYAFERQHKPKFIIIFLFLNA